MKYISVFILILSIIWSPLTAQNSTPVGSMPAYFSAYQPLPSFNYDQETQALNEKMLSGVVILKNLDVANFKELNILPDHNKILIKANKRTFKDVGDRFFRFNKNETKYFQVGLEDIVGIKLFEKDGETVFIKEKDHTGTFRFAEVLTDGHYALLKVYASNGAIDYSLRHNNDSLGESVTNVEGAYNLLGYPDLGQDKNESDLILFVQELNNGLEPSVK